MIDPRRDLERVEDTYGESFQKEDVGGSVFWTLS